MSLVRWVAPRGRGAVTYTEARQNASPKYARTGLL